MSRSELFDAQDMVIDAMENWGTQEGLELAQRALQLDPDNPDALALMATLASDLEGAKVLLEKALASAALRLGPNFEKEYKGVFWLDMDTRPYMSLLASMAHLLTAMGDRKEAVRLYERLLRLNPNDNQGIRYEVIGLLLAERMLPKTRKLLETYPKDDSAWFAWGRVLYYFAMKDRSTATKLLKKARKQNPFVELYMSGQKEFPEEPPELYADGEESEAILAAGDLMEAWTRRENAMLWLHGQLTGNADYIRYVARMIDGR